MIVPESMQPGLHLFAAMCRAIGIPGFEQPSPAPPAAPAVQASVVTWTPDTDNLLANADVQQGAVTAAQICRACHGKAGISQVPNYPNLRHQSADAIFKQLRDYKTGARQGGLAGIMAPIARRLNDQQMADVAV